MRHDIMMFVREFNIEGSRVYYYETKVRPDITVMVDWALKSNNQSIHQTKRGGPGGIAD